MEKINVIVFSLNKASILYNLIESIYLSSDNLFNINVLYESTNEKSEDEYLTLDKTFEINKWDVKLIKTNPSIFKKDLLNLLQVKEKYTCFLQDSSVFVDILDIRDVENALKNEDILCFSTILGLNTTFCNREKTKSIIVPSEEYEKTIVWDWTKHYLNYGNPFYVDGCIYRTKDMFKLSRSINFFTPEEYEQMLLIYEDFPRNLMSSYKKNILENSENK